MNFNVVWIFISLTFSLFSSEAAKMFNFQANLYQGANFSTVSKATLVYKKDERIRSGNQRENENLIGISPVLLGNLFARLVQLENFQKETEAKEILKEKIASKKAAKELNLLPKKNTTVGCLELASKKDLEDEKMVELFSQVKTLSLKIEALTLKYRSQEDKLSIFSSNLLELVHSVDAEKERREENSKKIAELSAHRFADIATMSKKIEELSVRIASLALQIDTKKGNNRLDFFSADTYSCDSLDSQNDDVSGMPSGRAETRAQSSDSTPI